MGNSELIKAIDLMDQAVDSVCLLPLLPPLAWLRSTMLDQLIMKGRSTPPVRDKNLVNHCQTMLTLCREDNWPLALPGILRQILTELCTEPQSTFSCTTEARAGCCLYQRHLRTFQKGEAVLTPLLRYYTPEIAAEEKRAYGEYASILQMAYKRQLLLYQCLAKAEAGDLRERYMAEAEEMLRLLPKPEELSRLNDKYRLDEENIQKKYKDLCHAADNPINVQFI